MAKRLAKTVDEILSGLEPGRKEMTQKLRSMVKNTIPDAIEIVRRGNTTYVLKGKDILSVRITQSHVNLLFACGTSCQSPLLTGRGSKGEPKHVKIKNMRDLDESELTRLLKEAERLV